MTVPIVTAATAGAILVLQIVLAFLVSMARGPVQTAVGDGGHDSLLRPIRRHGNLAENAGLFVVCLTLLELAQPGSQMHMALCGAFVLSRVAHAIGLSQRNTMNVFRFAGALGTYLTGLVLGGTLVWLAAPHVLPTLGL